MNDDVVAVIMAGGLGKRIGKNIPKVLLEVDGIPMIIRILLNLQELKVTVAELFNEFAIYIEAPRYPA